MTPYSGVGDVGGGHNDGHARINGTAQHITVTIKVKQGVYENKSIRINYSLILTEKAIVVPSPREAVVSSRSQGNIVYLHPY